MHEVQDIMLRYPLKLPKTHDLPCEEAVEKPAITTRLQSHKQSITELTQCCELRPRELKSRLLEQRFLKLRKLPIQELVIAPLVKFDTHVEATEASKHEIVANAYKLGYLDCRNSASPCCPLEHEDEAVEEKIAELSFCQLCTLCILCDSILHYAPIFLGRQKVFHQHALVVIMAIEAWNRWLHEATSFSYH
ncbi:unnamed protein product [Prunus armeniaca]